MGLFGSAVEAVRVVINGEEHVSPAAAKAEGGLAGFASKATKIIGGLAALGVGAALGGFFKRAIEESLGASAEMDRLRSAIGGTGASFDQLKPRVLDTITNLNRMTTFTQGDLRTALGTMITMTGDAEGSIKNLGLATDLAAARGIPLEQATEAISKAMAGNEMSLRKLMPALKESDDLFGDLERAVGGAAEAAGQTLAGQLARAKDQFGEFANAVGDAILGTEGLSDGGSVLVDLMVSLQNWVAENTDTIQGATGALVTMAKNIGGVVGPAFSVFGQVAGPVLKVVAALIVEMSFAVRSFAIFVQEAFGKAIQVVGGFANGVAGLLKKVGIDLNTEGLQKFNEFGEKLDRDASARWTSMAAEHKQFWTRTKDQTVQGEQQVRVPMEKMGAVAEEQFGRVAKGGKQAAEAVTQHMGPALQDMLGVTDDSLKRLAATATMTLEPKKAQDFNAEMQRLVVRGEEVRDRLLTWTPAVDQAKAKASAMTFDVADIARTALDAAQAFGLMGTEAASLLNSVVNVGQSIGKVLTGDLSGIGGVVAGVANIAKQITGGDAARQQLLRDNTRNLDRLAREVNGLRLGVTGETFSGVQGALTSVEGFLKKGFAFDAGGMEQLRKALFAQGLDFTDLDAVAKAMGFDIRNKNGALDGELLGIFLQALNTTGPTTVGGGFGDQLEQMVTGFGLRGTGGMEQLSSLFGLASRTGATAFQGLFDPSDIGSTRAGLLALFDRLESGGVAPSELGGMTGTQFRDFIVGLIGRIDNLSDAPSTAPAPPAAPPPGLDDPIVPGSGTTPTGTAGDLLGVFRSYTDLAAPHMVRMEDLTATIAENTGLTVNELRQVNAWLEIMSGGVGIDLIDAALAERRRLAEASAGGSPSP